MKTIAEHNKEAVKSVTILHTFTAPKIKWKFMGIMCPCGCKAELLEPDFNYSTRSNPVKCSVSGREGNMIYSDYMRQVIREIEWEAV